MDKTTLESSGKHRRRVVEVIATVALGLLLVTVHLMFFFWPFRYREAHPLLEQTFRSKVIVKQYHRTYFPHPGFVAEDVTFYRHGDTQIPPLATVQRMVVQGDWFTLIFRPHFLARIRLEGLHVQIPPPGTVARGMDFDQGVIDSSQSKLQIGTIVADHITLDFLRHDDAPVRFEFQALQIHNVQQNHAMTFYAKVTVPQPQGLVVANGSLGPFKTNAYGSTPLSGNYSLEGADLKSIDGLAGTAAAAGHYSGIFNNIQIDGNASIPDFRAGDAQAVRFDSTYRVTVNGSSGDVAIGQAQVRTGDSIVTASGSVSGSPKKATFTFATKDSRLEQLLAIVESSKPTVVGRVSFQAEADFTSGTGRFLQRLNLKGSVFLADARFISDKQEQVDDFSAREGADPSTNPKGAAPANPPVVYAAATTHTRFEHGIASLPDIHVTLPGADARMHGTFNLLDTQIHLTGTADLQRDLSHATTGWKAWIVKPLSPFFKHKNAGAVVSVAVTGTAASPKLTQNVLHTK